MALRLPSLLACLATVTLLWVFCVAVLKDRLAGALAGVLLLTSGLYAGPHVALTGDYDALLNFFVTVYVLAFWLALVDAKVRLRWIAVCGVAMVLAVFTKSIAGLLPVPAMVLYALLSGRLPALLRDGWIWAT